METRLQAGKEKIFNRYGLVALAASTVLHAVLLLLPVPSEESWGERRSSFMSVSLGGGMQNDSHQPLTVATKGPQRDRLPKQQQSQGKNADDGDNAEESPGADELRAYGRRIARAIRRVERRLRKSVGLDGTKVVLRIQINRDGNLITPPVIVQSSGNPSLDERAMAMVKYAAPFGEVPGSFLKDSAVILIPMRVAN